VRLLPKTRTNSYKKHRQRVLTFAPSPAIVRIVFISGFSSHRFAGRFYIMMGDSKQLSFALPCVRTRRTYGKSGVFFGGFGGV
jgi:hypothetical protein